jgi:hypothetical protein
MYMRKIMLFCIITLLTAVACARSAGLLTITGTSPAYDNAGTCIAPVLETRAPTAMWIHFLWTGPEAGHDSLSVAQNTAFVYTHRVTPGTYSIRAYAQDEGGVGCDTTIIKTVIKGPPWKIRP